MWNTICTYSDNKIFLLKNSCKYFWSTLEVVIFAGTKFCRYQILRLNLYLRVLFRFERTGRGQFVPVPCLKSRRQVLWSPNLAQIYTSRKSFKKHPYQVVAGLLFSDVSTFTPKNADFRKYSRMEHSLIKRCFLTYLWLCCYINSLNLWSISFICPTYQSGLF